MDGTKTQWGGVVIRGWPKGTVAHTTRQALGCRVRTGLKKG